MQKKINLGLSWLLLLGIFLAVILVLSGAILYLLQHGSNPLSDQHLSTVSLTYYTTYSPIFQGALHFEPFALILLGFLILVFSQILRVLVLGCYFLQGAEYWLALSSFFIFIVLMYSMF